MSRHFQRRRPKAGQRFSWGRVVDDDHGRVSYRLFRRGIDGRVYAEMRTFHREDDRSEIARTVWHMRIRLREAVDAVDIAALGIAA